MRYDFPSAPESLPETLPQKGHDSKLWTLSNMLTELADVFTAAASLESNEAPFTKLLTLLELYPADTRTFG